MSRWQALTELLEQASGTYSACVWRDGDVVYAYEADTVHASASLIKVPLCMTALESDRVRQQGGWGIDLATTVTLRDEDRVEGEGLFDQAPAGTVRTYAELIGHALRESDNTASNALIRALGMDAVNVFMRATPLELRTTIMRRHFIDWAAVAAGRENHTTAREMCQVFDVLLHESERYQALLDWLIVSPYNDKLPAGVPAGITVAHKVGDLVGIEHDVGIVYAPSGTFVVALLSSGLPDEQTGKATLAEASRLMYEAMTGPT